MAQPYDQDHETTATPPSRWPTRPTPPTVGAGRASTPPPSVPPPPGPPTTRAGAAPLPPPPPAAPPPPSADRWPAAPHAATAATWPRTPVAPPVTAPAAPSGLGGPPPVPPSAPPAAGGWGSPAPRPAHRPGRFRSRGARAVFVAALVVGLVLGGVAGGLAGNTLVSTSLEDALVLPDLPATAPSTPGAPDPGTGSAGTTGPGGQLSSWDEVTAAVSVGIVNIQSRMAGGIGSGTGMVLTPAGQILTNNHVVEDASTIVVTVATTGESYRATLVGTEPEQDVAVLQVTGASGMATIPRGDSDGVRVGDPVAAIGNAGGDGGAPDVATGRVTGLDQQITASDEDGGNVETLEDMIQVAADVVPGDSGGALADANGRVVGMTTAANAAGFTGPMRSRSNATGEGYAIPINKALDIAEQLAADTSSSGATQGSGAFLGVQVLQGAGGGAEIADVIVGSPAATAGLRAGDTVVAVDGVAVTTPDELVQAIADAEPGDGVALTYLDTSGRTREVTIELGAG